MCRVFQILNWKLEKEMACDIVVLYFDFTSTEYYLFQNTSEKTVKNFNFTSKYLGICKQPKATFTHFYSHVNSQVFPLDISWLEICYGISMKFFLSAPFPFSQFFSWNSALSQTSSRISLIITVNTQALRQPSKSTGQNI